MATVRRGVSRETAPIGNKGYPYGESQPDLSRKIYFVCCRLYAYILKRSAALCRVLYICDALNSLEEYFLSTKNGNRRRSPSKKHTSVGKKGGGGWVVKVILMTVVISAGLSMVSDMALSGAGYAVAFVVLALFILLGIGFDIIGVAATAADEKPFHSMASHKEVGATEAIRLIKNADKVSNFCSDVVGDISGIISGTTSAVIVSRLVADFSVNTLLLQLATSSVVAGLTIGGKALGKRVAITKSTGIVFSVGKVIAFFGRIRKKK